MIIDIDGFLLEKIIGDKMGRRKIINWIKSVELVAELTKYAPQLTYTRI